MTCWNPLANFSNILSRASTDGSVMSGWKPQRCAAGDKRAKCLSASGLTQHLLAFFVDFSSLKRSVICARTFLAQIAFLRELFDYCALTLRPRGWALVVYLFVFSASHLSALSLRGFALLAYFLGFRSRFEAVLSSQSHLVSVSARKISPNRCQEAT